MKVLAWDCQSLFPPKTQNNPPVKSVDSQAFHLLTEPTERNKIQLKKSDRRKQVLDPVSIFKLLKKNINTRFTGTPSLELVLSPKEPRTHPQRARNIGAFTKKCIPRTDCLVHPGGCEAQQPEPESFKLWKDHSGICHEQLGGKSCLCTAWRVSYRQTNPL